MYRYDFTHFDPMAALSCGHALRQLGYNARAMEEVTQRIVKFFYTSFGDERRNRSSCVLVRFYKTHAYRELPPELQQRALATLNASSSPPNLQCLTLMSSAGERPEWNDRRQSVAHQVIPLPSPAAVAQMPMIANLVAQFGLEVQALVAPDPALFTEMEQRTYNVFYVPVALDSPYIPAQDNFVRPYQIASVLGLGGVLPSGHVFALIIFSKEPIRRSVADLCKLLALDIKSVLSPYDRGKSFL